MGQIALKAVARVRSSEVLPLGVISFDEATGVYKIGDGLTVLSELPEFGSISGDVAGAIADLVGDAPAALDKLNELADALGDDPNFATTILNDLAGKQDIGTSVLLTDKGVADGVASLDGSATIPDAQIPTSITRNVQVPPSPFDLDGGYGLILGNGVHDDLPAINACIDANENLAVYLPQPDVSYFIDGSIQAKGSLTLFGETGWGGGVLASQSYMLTGNGVDPLIKTGDYPAGDSLTNRSVTLRNLSGTNNGARCVDFSTASNPTMEACAFDSTLTSSDDATVLVRYSARAHISRSYLTAKGGGWALSLRDNCNGSVLDRHWAVTVGDCDLPCHRIKQQGPACGGTGHRRRSLPRLQTRRRLHRSVQRTDLAGRDVHRLQREVVRRLHLADRCISTGLCAPVRPVPVVRDLQHHSYTSCDDRRAHPQVPVLGVLAFLFHRWVNQRTERHRWHRPDDLALRVPEPHLPGPDHRHQRDPGHQPWTQLAVRRVDLRHDHRQRRQNVERHPPRSVRRGAGPVIRGRGDDQWFSGCHVGGARCVHRGRCRAGHHRHDLRQLRRLGRIR